MSNFDKLPFLAYASLTLAFDTPYIRLTHQAFDTRPLDTRSVKSGLVRRQAEHKKKARVESGPGMPAKKKARVESGVKVTESVTSEPEPRSGKAEAKQREPEVAPSGTRPSPEGAISFTLREQTFALRGLEASKVPAAAVDVSALIQECWIGRKSASAMLFRARNLQLAKLLEHLTPFIFQSPCPSPILLEHMKETLVATWADDPQLVNDTIKSICGSFSPSNASAFRSAIEICATYLKNIWSEPHPDDWFDQGDAAAEENSAQWPFDAVVPCLRLLVGGIVECRKRGTSTCKAARDSWRQSISMERNMEFCTSTLQALFSSDVFWSRAHRFPTCNTAEWATFKAELTAAYSEFPEDPKLQRV